MVRCWRLWFCALQLVFGASSFADPLLIQRHAVAIPDSQLARPFRRDEWVVHRFLNQFPVLRIAITEATGNGHQAAGVYLIKRLRQLQYAGHIELYYAPAVRLKLEYLLPPFRANGPDHQILRDLDVETFLLSRYPDTVLPLGLMGADKNGGQNLTPEELNVQNLLVIQPSRWGDSPYLFRPNKNDHRMWQIPAYWPTYVPYSRPHDIAELIASQMGHSSKLAAKIPALQALLAGREPTNFLAAYGLGIEGSGKLVTLIRALKLAQERDAALKQKPMVIALLSNLNDKEWADVDERLSHYSEKTQNIQWIDASGPQACAQLAQLQPSDIAVLKVGNVTQDIWNLLMETSPLPPLVAGSNGTNFLFQLGRPFLITAMGASFDWMEVFSEASGTPRLYDRMAKATADLMFKDAEGLAQFYVEANNPNSVLVQKFRLHAKVLQKRPDRVCAALLEGKRLMRRLKPASVPRTDLFFRLLGDFFGRQSSRLFISKITM
jgi:hypothetical protein